MKDEILLEKFVRNSSGNLIRKKINNKKGNLPILPFRPPVLYEKFLLSYYWIDFEVGPIRILRNPKNRSWDNVFDDLCYDNGFKKTLLGHQAFPFARVAGGGWNPVCFDMSKKGKDGKVIQLDHEEILINEKIKVIEIMAGSFKDFLENNLDSEKIDVEM